MYFFFIKVSSNCPFVFGEEFMESHPQEDGIVSDLPRTVLAAKTQRRIKVCLRVTLVRSAMNSHVQSASSTDSVAPTL
jgi:glycerol-3-phosphate responsive antiterminator